MVFRLAKTLVLSRGLWFAFLQSLQEISGREIDKICFWWWPVHTDIGNRRLKKPYFHILWVACRGHCNLNWKFVTEQWLKSPRLECKNKTKRPCSWFNVFRQNSEWADSSQWACSGERRSIIYSGFKLTESRQWISCRTGDYPQQTLKQAFSCSTMLVPNTIHHRLASKMEY